MKEIRVSIVLVLCLFSLTACDFISKSETIDEIENFKKEKENNEIVEKIEIEMSEKEELKPVEEKKVEEVEREEILQKDLIKAGDDIFFLEEGCENVFELRFLNHEEYEEKYNINELDNECLDRTIPEEWKIIFDYNFIELNCSEEWSVIVKKRLNNFFTLLSQEKRTELVSFVEEEYFRGKAVEFFRGIVMSWGEYRVEVKSGDDGIYFLKAYGQDTWYYKIEKFFIKDENVIVNRKAIEMVLYLESKWLSRSDIDRDKVSSDELDNIVKKDFQKNFCWE